MQMLLVVIGLAIGTAFYTEPVESDYPRLLKRQIGKDFELRIEFSAAPESYLSVMPTRLFVKPEGGKAAAISIEKVRELRFISGHRKVRIVLAAGAHAIDLGPMTSSTWNKFVDACNEYFERRLPFPMESD